MRTVAGAVMATLAVVLAAPAFGSDEDGAARLQGYLDRARTFSAAFEQSVYDDRMKPLERSTGRVYIRRPGRFRWEYRQPFEQAIVSDGDKVWVHDPDLEQVTVRSLDDTIGSSPATLLTGDRPVAEAFDTRDLGAQGGITWVGLQPRAEDATFSEIRLGLDEDGLRFMELVDNFGQLTQLTFEDREVNPDLEERLFRFVPPEGTDVIGE